MAGLSHSSLRRGVASAAIAIVVVLLTAWATVALYFSNLPALWLRATASLVFLFGTAGAFALLPNRRRTTVWFLAAVSVIGLWWWTISPSHDREWSTPVAVLPHATLVGDVVTVHDVRNFAYRDLDDFDVRYEDRVYDISELSRVDLILSYWDGNRSIAHMLLSFGFDDGRQLALSVETRPEKGEGYSVIAGFFKQFEIIYLLADECDVVALRTHFRHEDVFVYPIIAAPAHVQTLFRGVLERVNRIYETPEFYDALTDNCTTSLLGISEAADRERLPFDMRLLLNGYLDELAYERGGLVADITDGLPYPEMRNLHAVSELARELAADSSFSVALRRALPRRDR